MGINFADVILTCSICLSTALLFSWGLGGIVSIYASKNRDRPELIVKLLHLQPAWLQFAIAGFNFRIVDEQAASEKHLAISHISLWDSLGKLFISLIFALANYITILNGIYSLPRALAMYYLFWLMVNGYMLIQFIRYAYKMIKDFHQLEVGHS